MIDSAAPLIETRRLILRHPVPSDVGAFLEFYKSDRSFMAGGPLDEKHAWQAFAADFGHWAILGFGRFIVTLKEDERPIGLVGHYAPHPRPENEIGWVLFDAAHEGKGLASEAAEACIDYAWRVLEWETIVSYIAKGNANSIRLAERLGATVDVAATQPKPNDPCLVYRHPRPEGL